MENSQNDQHFNNEKAGYFDLHINGLGYLNRARMVKPKKAAQFLAVDINAMSGEVTDPSYTRFDCKVVGSDAIKIVTALKPEIDAKKAVLVGFRLGDLYPDLFEYQSGEKKGQTGVSLKTRLLKIDWVKVDGKAIELSTLLGTEEPAASVA